MVTAAREKPIPLARVADHFGVSEQTVRNWTRAGLTAYRMGRLIFTEWRYVDAFKQPLAVDAVFESDKRLSEVSETYEQDLRELRAKGFDI